MRTPTRTARAIAFLLDGGLASLLMLQAFGVALWLGAVPPDAMASPEVQAVVIGQWRWFFVLSIVLVLGELLQAPRFVGGASSVGFAVTGLALEDGERAWVRRIPRTLVPIIALLVAAGLLHGLDLESGPEVLSRVTMVMGIGGVVVLAFFAVDALVVLSNPTNRTLGDRFARTNVVASPPSAAIARRALSLSSSASFLAVLAYAITWVEQAAASSSQMALFTAPASYVAYFVPLTIAAAIATTDEAVHDATDARRIHPLAIAFLATIPIVSFFFLRGWTRKLVERLDLQHSTKLGVVAAVDFATAANGLVGAIALVQSGPPAARAFLSQFGLTEMPTAVEPIVDPRMLAIGGFVGTLALGVAMRRLSELELERVVTHEPVRVETVFE